jgi:hypothetical protein
MLYIDYRRFYKIACEIKFVMANLKLLDVDID